MSNLVEKYLWVEKYQPRKIDDMVLTEDYRAIFKKFTDDKEIPQLLLYGPPGSGKTTMAKILIRSIIKDSMDILPLNGSVSTGVDVMRNQVEEFLKTPPLSSKIKIVFIDEADYLSLNAQGALRGITEFYQEHGRFLFTCNFITKIIAPLQSRFGQSFEFKRLPKEFVYDFCVNILTKENIQFDKASVDKVITTFYPDVRRIIHVLQSRCENGSLQIQGKDIETKENIVRSLITEVLLYVSQGSPKLNDTTVKLLEFLTNNEIDYVYFFDELFRDKNVPAWAKIIINKYGKDQISSILPYMNCMAMVYEIISVGKKLRELKR